MNIRILFLIFLFLSFLTACADKKVYRIEFDNVNGLKENADVIYKGQEIGSVDKIELNENRKIIVTLKIEKKFAFTRKIQVCYGFTRFYWNKSN